MGALTARIELYLPGGGSLLIGGPDEPADIDKINQNFQKLDEAIGAPEFTSSTRPSAPFPGQIIQETDTGDVLFWSDTETAWLLLKPHVGDTPPADPQEGDLWVDTN